jgi:hypothetical protein
LPCIAALCSHSACKTASLALNENARRVLYSALQVETGTLLLLQGSVTVALRLRLQLCAAARR